MDAVLRQSKAVCPFLKKASPATLRALSTTATRPSPAQQLEQQHHAPAAPAAMSPSPCGGTMTKLQVLADRCPVMSKAMAVQSARAGRAFMGAAAATAANHHHHHHGSRVARAGIHTSRIHGARALEDTLLNHREKGMGRALFAGWNLC